MATTKITNPELFDLGSLNTALKLPSGTTAQRPTSPSTGEWRYNTTTNLVEFWDGGEWRDLQSEDIPPIPSENFNTVLYTGNGTSQSITGVGFKPDFVWVKARDRAGEWHMLSDSTRGTNSQLFSNEQNPQDTKSTVVTSFDSDGFSIGSDNLVNFNGADYVAWCWKANGGTTTAGTGTGGTSSVTHQLNGKAGFCITKFVSNNNGGTSGGSTVNHGLDSTPDFIIMKSTTSTQAWWVWHNSFTSGNDYLQLQTDGAKGSSVNVWNGTAPDASKVTLGNWNNQGATFIMYAFKSVAEYSKIGSYTGNGSTDGPIKNTGFEPAWLMVKGSSNSGSWIIFDNKRNTTNPRDKALRADSSAAETTSSSIQVDFLSNGFQLTGTDTDYNGSGRTYIYIAFASDPSAAPALPDSFATALYAGTGSANSLSGLGFSPSLTWIKRRNSSASHSLTDSNRGNDLVLQSNETSAEASGQITLDSDGFTIGNDNALRNAIGSTYVAWNWKANPIPIINTDGTIQSVVSANQAAGFSIVKYTGDGTSGATIGHGLSSAPETVISKSLDSSNNWNVFDSSLTTNYMMKLNATNAQFDATAGTKGGGITVDATTMTILAGASNQENNNKNGDEFIAYCFASISGFSKMGSYSGGSTGSGNVITTGFQPDWIMLKRTDTSDNWTIMDSARGDGASSRRLIANTNGTEKAATSIWFPTSTGFYFSGTGDSYNASGGTYIYMAFKTTPTTNTVPAGQMAYLVGSGGGGSGEEAGGFASSGAGGGAGGLRTSYGLISGGGASAESNLTLSSGTYTITIGAGGSPANDGTATTVTGNASISTVGGGGGGENSTGRTGGSGGGGGSNRSGSVKYNGGAGTTGEGFGGSIGDVFFWSAIGNDFAAGGGGGGAASAGVSTNIGTTSMKGQGGDGLRTTINNDAGAYFAAGGGGFTIGIPVNGAGHHSEDGGSTENGQPNTSDGASEL